MRKVRRSIKRIDVPSVLALEPRPSPFLAIDPMRRKRSLQLLHYQSFTRPIGLRYQINIAFILSCHPLGIKISQQSPRLPRNPLGHMRKLKLLHHSHRTPASPSLSLKVRNSKLIARQHSTQSCTGGHIYPAATRDRKSTRLNSSHMSSSYAVFCLKKKISMW